jgi:hypothetical protein
MFTNHKAAPRSRSQKGDIYSAPFLKGIPRTHKRDRVFSLLSSYSFFLHF